MIAIAGCPSTVVSSPFSTPPVAARISFISCWRLVNGVERREAGVRHAALEPLVGEELRDHAPAMVSRSACVGLEVHLVAQSDEVEAVSADLDVPGAPLPRGELEVECDRRAAGLSRADDMHALGAPDGLLHLGQDLGRRHVSHPVRLGAASPPQPATATARTTSQGARLMPRR